MNSGLRTLIIRTWRLAGTRRFRRVADPLPPDQPGRQLYEYDSLGL
ncbi:hypothetical protein RHDE110596_16210 [Prescottella defluvii]